MAIRRRKPQPQTVTQDEAGLEDELVTLASVLANYPPGTVLYFGSPSRCPECGDYGLVGTVAHDTGRCTNHCRVCRRDWTITRRAVRAHRQAPVRPTPVGRGVLYEALLAEGESVGTDGTDEVDDAVADHVDAPAAPPLPPPPRPIARVAPVTPAPAFDGASPTLAARSVVDLSSTSGPAVAPVPRVATSGLVSAHRF